MTLSCVAPRCAIPRRHVPGCDGDQCRGCLPALATVGRLCERCHQRADSTLVDIGELYVRLDDALIPALGAGQKVSGTPERTAPINLDVHDLLAPSRLGTVHDDWHDQTGQPSVAAVLETWARDWAETAAQRPPDPDVDTTARWLRARLEWAARHHNAIDEFIAEMRNLHGRLITVLHERDPQPELCHGVPCRGCDERNLYRRADGSNDVDCHSCGLIYRKAEYDRWTALLAASTKRMVNA